MRSELFIKKPIGECVARNLHFAQGITGWDSTFPVSFTGRIAYLNSQSISQDDVLTEGVIYEVRFTVTAPKTPAPAAGEITCGIGDELIGPITAPGTYKYYVDTTGFALLSIGFSADSDCNMGLCGISVKTASFETVKVSFYGEDIELSLAIADSRELRYRNSGYSRIISIPATPENDIVFQREYEPGAENSFGFKKAYDAFVIQDGREVFSGVFELESAETGGRPNSYSGRLYAHNGGLYFSMGSALLRGNADPALDLSFSEYSEVFDAQNIVASFSAAPGSGILYLPIDRTAKYGLANEAFFRYGEMSPCLYAKEIWDKIFEKHGYSYQSDFLNSEFFSRLALPKCDGKVLLDETEAASNAFEGYEGSSGIYAEVSPPSSPTPSAYPPHYEETIETSLWNDVTQGSLNPYDPFTGEYVAASNGDYDISLSFAFKGELSAPGYAGLPGVWYLQTQQAGFQCSCRLVIERVDGTVEPLAFEQEGFPIFEYISFGNSLQVDLIKMDADKPVNLNPLFSKTLTYEGKQYLAAGDTVRLEMRALLPFVWSDGTGDWLWTTYYTGQKLRMRLTTSSASDANYLKISKRAELAENCFYDPTDVLRADLTQAEFVTSIINMFNLFSQPLGDGAFKIEPYPAFFDATASSQKDWDAKLDASSTFLLERHSDTSLKILKYKYAKDSDAFLDAYANSANKEYGERVYWGNDASASAETQTVELSFAPTCCGPLLGSNRVLVPKMYKQKSDGTADETASFKQRILHYAGLKNAGGNYFRLFSDNYQDWEAEWQDIETYPYASHFNLPYGDETADLMFDSPDWNWETVTWQPGVSPTWNNLFNLYYREMIESYASAKSKRATAYFDLSPSDIADFKFSDRVFVKNHWWRVESIEGYAPGALSKVVMTLLDEATVTQTPYPAPNEDLVKPPLGWYSQDLPMQPVDFIDAGIADSNSAPHKEDVLGCDLIDGGTVFLEKSNPFSESGYFSPAEYARAAENMPYSRQKRVIWADLITTDTREKHKPSPISHMRGGYPIQ